MTGLQVVQTGGAQLGSPAAVDDRGYDQDTGQVTGLEGCIEQPAGEHAADHPD